MLPPEDGLAHTAEAGLGVTRRQRGSLVSVAWTLNCTARARKNQHSFEVRKRTGSCRGAPSPALRGQGWGKPPPDSVPAFRRRLESRGEVTSWERGRGGGALRGTGTRGPLTFLLSGPARGLAIKRDVCGPARRWAPCFGQALRKLWSHSAHTQIGLTWK